MSNENTSSNQVFYSQHGEDFLLSKLFENKTDGFFVEVGCIDGKRFSNSLFFEEIGWRGICIEAHSGYIKMLKANRPCSIVEHAAVGERDKNNVNFFANSRGSLSTLDKTKETEFAQNYGKYFTGFEVQKVSMLTLNTIFKKHGIQDIDFLSLDIEGYEVNALKGLDLCVYRPKIFVIESDSAAHRNEIESILFPAGYHFITALNQDLFYSLNIVHRRIIGYKTFKNVRLVHTQHPLDSTGDNQIVVDVSTTNKNSILRMFNRIMFLPLKRKRRRFDFFEVGFHGDKYLLQLVEVIIRNCDYFIETGTNVGSTIAYVGKNYVQVKCLSCEPDTEAFNYALKNTSELPNVSIYNECSQGFILRLEREYNHLFNKNVLFWLDSHGYGFKWPLREEIAFITDNFKSPYILIDDFKVPGLDFFGYDEYEGQECSLDYIKDALNPKKSYHLYYPIYTDRTSKHHPLRGWGLIESGHKDELKMPDSLRDKIQHVDIPGSFCTRV